MQFPRISLDENVIGKIARKYHIKIVYVFGSALGNDFNETSDIDLLITFEATAHPSLFDLVELKAEFEHVLGHNVDIVEKEAIKNPFRKKEIIKTAKVLYAA
jgi:predicted nucleotidyltransferase